MTTTPTSVDALRTRLARAFEVAALRDPSAELAAFEAAVRGDERHEHGERIAKACEAAKPKVRDIWDDEGKGWSDACRYLAERARDLSPPP